MVDAHTHRTDLGPVNPTALGSFVKLERCDQYLGWRYLAENLLGGDGRFEESILSPLYAESGTQFELDQLRSLTEQHRVDTLITPEDDTPDGLPQNRTWEADAPTGQDGETNTWASSLNTLIEQITNVAEDPETNAVICFQPSLSGQVGAWEIAGKADIIVIRPARSGTPESGTVVDMLEVKASAGEQTHHRIQAACYTKLIKEALAAEPAAPSDVTFTGRVVHRGNAITGVGYEGLEPFDLEPTETDIELLLRAGGRLDKIVFEMDDGEFDSDDVTRVDPSEMSNRMSRRCAGCSYHDVCYTRAIEEDGLELLGFPEGTQEDLADVDIDTLGDLGSILESNEYVYPAQRTDEQVEIQDQDLFERVRDEVGLKDLERYSIAADVFSTENSSDRPHSTTYIPDSGYNLPAGEVEDSPLPDSLTFYPDRSLIRVHLFVQHDNIRDRIVLLGGFVTNHDTEERRYVSAITDGLPGADPEDSRPRETLEAAKDETEIELLRNFLRGTDTELGLVEAIQEVAPADLGEYGDELENPGFVHLYFYSPAQRNALTQAAKRHADEREEFEALRTLLGLRGEIGERNIDQEMVSVLQEEFVTRHLLRFLGFGTVQTVEQFERPNPAIPNGPPTYRNWGSGRQFSWQHDVGDGFELPLQHLFDEHLFENAVNYNRNTEHPLDVENGLSRTTVGDNYEEQFPFAHRHTDTIPLEYIWGAFDELTPDQINPEAFDDPQKGERLQRLVRRFRNAGAEGEGHRLEHRHLRGLAEKMAAAVEHIEGSIVEWNKDSATPKQPLPLDRLLTLEFDESPLATTGREYLDLEHEAKRRQLTRDWRQSISYRVQEGKSVLFTCTNPPDPNDETHTIEGEIMIPGGGTGLTDSSFSEGDWVVMTPVNDEATPPVELGINKAADMERMPLVHITEISEDRIQVAAPWNGEGWSWPASWHDFMNSHHRYLPGGHPEILRDDVEIEGREFVYDPTGENDRDELRFINSERDAGPNQLIIDEGAAFILDEAADNVINYHCSRALNLSENNHVLHWLDGLLTGNRNELQTDYCDPTLIEDAEDDHVEESFVDTHFIEADTIDFEPNDQQRRFIRETQNQLVVVQGPPGTGKTSYTISPGVLGRAYAFAQANNSFTGAISALSHDAVDEVFSEIVDVARDCQPAGCFERMKIVRVRPSSLPDEAVPYNEREDDALVEHIAYNQDAGAARLRELYEQFVLEDSSDDEAPTQFLIAGPPTSIRGAVDKVARLLVDIEDVDRAEDQDYPPTGWELLEYGGRANDIFDLTVIDEASMMDLPQLFLAGAFLDTDGQLLLAGDHRQMQPIRAYGWEEETRETIEDTVPFLSALDYIRFLKGDIDDMEFIERDSPDLDAGLTNAQQEQASLPIYPLEETYRLPGPVANMLTNLFYKQDGIQLHGRDDRDPIPPVNAQSDLIQELVNPDEWVSVLVHSGTRDERTSALEAAIADRVLDEFNIVEPEEENLEQALISAGVVVPFTAQRDGLQSQLDDAVQAQTVEKFQGGERDLIILSMVASDPGYVNMLSEFLLSPYRFNVGASRMKRKLIIVASEAVFQTSHPDADQYDDQLAWKRLYQLIGALNPDVQPAAADGAQSIDTSLSEDARCEVYHARLPEDE